MQSVITFTKEVSHQSMYTSLTQQGSELCVRTSVCVHVCVVTHTYFSRTAWTSIPEEFHLQAGANESKHT